MSRSKKLITLAIVFALAVFSIAQLLSTRSLAPSTTPAERAAAVKRVPAQASPQRVQERLPLPALVTADWAKTFRSSRDYFDFVSLAATRALEGDGRAALYVSRALTTCKLETKLYANSSNPESAFESDWATRPSAPKWLLDKARSDFKACSGFFKGDAFASLPQQPGGYDSIGFWRDLAYDDGDPVAQAVHAGLGLARIGQHEGDAYVEVLVAAQVDLNSAVISQDPEAIFMVGRILLNGHTGDPLEGLAVTIAACDLGYDCSTGNEAIFGVCVASDTCAAGLTYADVVTQGIGAAAYAKAYARAQEFEDAVARGDNSALQQFVLLDRTR